MRKILLLSILFSASTTMFTPNVWGQLLQNKPKDNPYAQFDTSHPCEGTNCIMMQKGSADAGTSSYGPADTVCSSAKTKVDTICIGNNNPGIQTAVTLIASVGSAGLSITDACSKFNSALKTANEAITAYNAACGAAGLYCENVCNTAAEKAQAAAMETAGASMNIYNADMLVKTACTTSMKKNLKDAAYGLAGIIASSALAKSCENKTTDTAATCKATAADGTVNSLCINGVDCSLSTNASNPTCICNSSPNASGCPGATDYGSSYGAPNYGGSSGDNSTSQTVLPPVTAAGNSGLDATTRNAAAIPPAAAANGGGSGGGGAVAGDGMSAAADSKKSATVDKKNSLNPNILSGYDGGGGGGGSRGGSVSGSSAYGAYMPGATKDPSRALASQARAGGQVTSAGSKSNWEKINERYMENKSTLMGE